MQNRRTNVLITRPFSSLEKRRPLLSPARSNVCACPTISVRPVPKSRSIGEIFCQIRTFDFVIFTSQNAVAKTVEYLRDMNIGLDQFKRSYICAVGPVTADTLSKLGIKTNLIPPKYTAQALASLFPVMHTHAPKILFPRGSMSSNVLTDELARKGYQVMSPVLYVTEPRMEIEDDVRRLISQEQVHCIAITSPSSVVAFKSLIGEESCSALFEKATVAAIGPITSAACVEAGARVEIQPENYTLGALAKDIASHFSNTAASQPPRPR